jgi:multicomponent Na+:H+ antiporter subunit E
MIRYVSLVATLFAFWLLLSGIFTPFLLAAGLGCAIAVTFVARRMDVVDREGHPIHLAWGAFVSYWPWLAIEIIRSAWHVTRIVLKPGLPVSPTLTAFVPSQKTDLGLVIHANSITLTPGTVVIEAERGRFLVHALTREGAAGLADSEMDRRCARLEAR